MIDVQVDARGLREALAGSVAARSTMPILEHALLEAGEDGLRMVTSDHEKWVTQKLASEVKTPGKIAADAVKLKAALTGIEGDARLSLKDTRLTLSAGRLRYTIPNLPAEHFPDPKTLTPEPVEFNAESLRDALQRVAYAAAKTEVRVWMNGVWLETNCTVATDGYRIAMSPANIDLPEGLAIGIPIASVKHVVDRLTEHAEFRLLRKEGADTVAAIEVGAPENTVRVMLLDGKMADWRRALPRPTGEESVVATQAPSLAAAMARIAPFSIHNDKGHKSSRVELTVKDSDIVIKPGHDDASEDHVPCHLEGPVPEVLVNNLFFSDMLAQAKGADVVWTSSGGGVAQCFEFVGRDDTHYIMPMRR